MLRALVSGLALIALAGCGGQSAEDIANALRGIAEKARDPEAVERATCRALERFSSKGATTLSELLEAYYRPRGYAGEPGADDLADAAGDVNKAQEAADVAANLGC